MNINKPTLIFVILLCYFQISFAENLLEVYHLAIERDPIVLAARENQLAEKENLVIARSKFLPNVGVSGSQVYGRMTDSLYGYNKVNNNSNNYTLNISQPIFQVIDWMRYKQTQKSTLAVLKRYEDTEQTLIFRVADKYFAVLAAIDQLETSKSATQAFSKRLEQATQQFKVGVAALTDVNDAQARLDTTRAKEIFDANALNTAKEELSKIIGKFINNISQLKQQISLVSPDPANVDVWIEKARKYNLQLQAAHLDVAAAREAIRVSSSGHLPTLTLNGSITKSGNPVAQPVSPIKDKTRIKQLALNLNVPIFSGGETVANTQSAIFKANAALQQLEAAYRDAESNTRVAYNSVLAQINQVEALRQSVKSNRVALKATQAAFGVGTRTIVDVLNSQSDLLNAERDYIKAKYDYILQSLRLKQATGSLNVTDLEQINNLLEKSNKDDSNKSSLPTMSSSNEVVDIDQVSVDQN